MALFFSTSSHKTHLSLLFRQQSGCSELMRSWVLGWECQSFTCHPAFPSRGTVLRGTLIDQIVVHEATLLTSLSPSTLPSLNFLFSPLSSLRMTFPASFHSTCESHDLRKAQVSLLRVRAGDNSVSEKRGTFPL